jgi:hypothetical protein
LPCSEHLENFIHKILNLKYTLIINFTKAISSVYSFLAEEDKNRNGADNMQTGYYQKKNVLYHLTIVLRRILKDQCAYKLLFNSTVREGMVEG